LNFLLAVPILVKVIGTLILIILLNRLLHNLLAAVSLGTVILGLWSGHSLIALVLIAWRRFSSLNNVLLLVVILLVIWLSTRMSTTGVMEDLVQTVQSGIPRRAAFAALPAVIGFLPMPGGAIFSAPLVEGSDQNSEVMPIVKAQTNYWFRHIWEYWWPLYPGVILALDLTGLEIWQFVLVQFPITLVAILSGYLFILRRIPNGRRTVKHSLRIKKLIALLLPIVTVIVVYLLIQTLLPGMVAVSRYLPMLIGLSLALLVVQLQRKGSASDWIRTVLNRKTLLLVVLIGVIRIYGAVIETPLPGGTLMVEALRVELAQIGIPVLAVVMLIPFITGLAMGLAIGCVGASFPILLSLMGPDPGLGMLLSYTVLAYGFGFMGQLLSPVHVCLLVSSQYFKTSLLRVLIGLIPPVSVVMVGILIVSQAVLRIVP
jgi:hypothetical protein